MSVAVSRYLSEVMGETEHLVFGNPHGFRFDHRLLLQDVWVAQDATVIDTGDALGEAPLRERVLLGKHQTYPIDVALNMSTFKKAVVVGPPGYGKTTLCRRLAYKQALDAKMTSRGWIPVRIAAHMLNQSGVWAPNEDLLTRVPLVEHNPDLFEQLSLATLRGELWVFLDGLDELDESRLTELKSRLASGILASPNRVTITCRVADYQPERASRRLPGVPVLELSGFTEDRVDFYVENWHRRAGQGRSSWSQSRLSATRGLLDAHSELRALAASPLLAAVVCVVESKLQPESAGRAVLLKNAVDYLLLRPEWRYADNRGSQLLTLDPQTLTEMAARLAFGLMSGTVFNSQGMPMFAVSRRELQTYVSNTLVDLASYDASDQDELDLATSAYLDRLVGKSAAGLLQESQSGHYEFAHRCFQEYLAAQHIAGHIGHVERLGLARQRTWAEVFVFTASIAQVTREGLGELLMLVRALLQEARSPLTGQQSVEDIAHGACLAAEMLAELGEAAAKRYGFEAAVADSVPTTQGDPSFAGLWALAVSVVFDLARDIRLSGAMRMRSLCVVSRLRDPRFLDAAGRNIGDLGVTVPIPGGEGHVGTAQPLEMREAKQVPSSPRRHVRLSPFAIGKRQVTNSEYAEFVDAKGYDDPSWWRTPEALRWSTGDDVFVRELVALWEQQKDLNFVKEFSEPDFAVYAKHASEQIAGRTMLRNFPLYWRDSRFNLPTAPVVGVNLWEARAYCCWLEDRWRSRGVIGPTDTVGVPTEIEWEWAASRQWTGAPRIYPWGSDFDSSKCLVRDFSAADTSPPIIHFGAIPVGYSDLLTSRSDDPQDMGGNVWEWVDSLSLPWSNDGDRNAQGGLAKRVVRGGSWFSREPLSTRVSFRLDDPPCNAYWDLGFRVALRGQGTRNP